MIVVRYEPPSGVSPGAMRYIYIGDYDILCFTCDLLSLAVRGLLRIDAIDDPTLKARWRLGRTGAPLPPDLTRPERTLLDTLFAEHAEVRFGHDEQSTLVRARKAHHACITDGAGKAMYTQPGIGFGCLLPLVLSGIGLFTAGIYTAGGIPLLIWFLSLFVIAILLLSFFLIDGKPTPKGRAALDVIEGLMRYMRVAERSDLDRLKPPGPEPLLDHQTYSRLLPFAVALEIDEAWTRKFGLAVGTAAASAAVAGFEWLRAGETPEPPRFGYRIRQEFAPTLAGASVSRAEIARALRSTPSSHHRSGFRSGGGGGGHVGGGGGGGGGGGR